MVTQGTFMWNYFKIRPLVKEKSFKGFSILSSGSHLVHPSRTGWAIFAEGHRRNISCEISLKLCKWPRRCCFKVFLLLALVAILFSEWNHLGNFGGGSPKEHSCKMISKSIHRFRRCLSELLTDGRQTLSGHKSSPWAFGSGELKQISRQHFKTF